MKKSRAALSLLVAGAAVFGVAVAVRSSDRPGLPTAQPSVARSAAGAIARAEATLRETPNDTDALALLATSALSRAKETADSTWYARSESAARRALALDPKNVPALDAAATLANARHRFHDALAPAQASRRIAPDRFAPLEILTDANIEIGRYRVGFALAEQRLALRPDLASYSRASYAAELQGDRLRATQLMELAAEAGRPGTGDRTWALTHVGFLRFGSGDLPGAERAIRGALRETPGDATALAGLAKVRAGAGDLDDAASLYRQALDAQPVAGYAAALAEVEEARGRTKASAESLDLANELDRREAANGVELELDSAATDADVRVPTADDVRRVRRGYRLRPGVAGDDAMGWVLTRAGLCDEGLRFARRSLRLGTKDALMFFHAAMAARCAGKSREAVSYLRAARCINPYFSVRWAPVAERMLAELDPS